MSLSTTSWVFCVNPPAANGDAAKSVNFPAEVYLNQLNKLFLPRAPLIQQNLHLKVSVTWTTLRRKHSQEAWDKNMFRHWTLTDVRRVQFYSISCSFGGSGCPKNRLAHPRLGNLKSATAQSFRRKDWKNTYIGGSMKCNGHSNDPDPMSQKSCQKSLRNTVLLCWAICISLSAKRFVFKINQ